MRALLDINVIIALLDSGHVMHASFDQRIRVELVPGASAAHLARIDVSDA